MVLVFAGCRRRNIKPEGFIFIEGILGSPEGTSGPRPCLQGVVGYTTKRRRKTRGFPVRRQLCLDRPKRERHNLTADARLLSELRQSEQNRSTSSQGVVVFKQSPSHMSTMWGLRQIQGWEKAECRIETFCILTSFLHEGRLNGKLCDYEN